MGLSLLWRYTSVCSGALGIIGLSLAIESFARKTLKTNCPFCAATIAGVLGKAPSQIVRCSECFEYSLVESGLTRALDPNLKLDKPRYWSPVFEGAVWPNGCVECGGPPTRVDAIRDTTLNVLALTVGIAMIQKASLGNVPYCDAHKDAVLLSYSQSKKMDLRWKSLRMMRRYLAVNRGKASLGSKTIINP